MARQEICNLGEYVTIGYAFLNIEVSNVHSELHSVYVARFDIML